MLTRRSFLSWLAPLAVIPVVGPHMLLSERPAQVQGWRPVEKIEFQVFYQTADGKLHTTIPPEWLAFEKERREMKLEMTLK